MKENDKGNLAEACAAYLLDKAQRLTADDVGPHLPPDDDMDGLLREPGRLGVAERKRFPR
jgi:hypothetical protein